MTLTLICPGYSSSDSILLGNVPRQKDHVVFGHDLGLDHDPHFPAGLNGISLYNTGIGAGQLFQLLQAADIVLHVLTPCAGTAAEMASAACTRTAITVLGSTSP